MNSQKTLFSKRVIFFTFTAVRCQKTTSMCWLPSPPKCPVVAGELKGWIALLSELSLALCLALTLPTPSALCPHFSRNKQTWRDQIGLWVFSWYTHFHNTHNFSHQMDWLIESSFLTGLVIQEAIFFSISYWTCRWCDDCRFTVADDISQSVVDYWELFLACSLVSFSQTDWENSRGQQCTPDWLSSQILLGNHEEEKKIGYFCCVPNNLITGDLSAIHKRVLSYCKWFCCSCCHS